MTDHYDKNGNLMSYTDSNGNRFNANHELIGSSKDNVLFDRNGQTIGYTDGNGTRFDQYGRTIGYTKDGARYSANHEFQGKNYR